MRDILITIRDDRCMDCIPQPLVEGENNTTQIVVTAPASWDGFLLRCLLTTPKGVLVDAVDALPSVPLINTMLDGPGVLKVEFIAMKGGTEVDRTLYPAILPVNAARNPLGEIPPEPLPDFIAQMEVARTGALGAATTATEAAALADGAAANTLQTNEMVQAAENIRSAFYEKFNEDINKLKFNPNCSTTEEAESALLGEELIDGSGWSVGAGWSGSFENGFIHAPGNTAELSRSIPLTGTKLYLVELTVDTPTKNTDFYISIGGSYNFIMYEGDFTHHTYSRAIKSISNGSLVITPGSSFDGTITGITVKEVISSAIPSATITDSELSASMEIRATTSTLKNVFVGKESGRFNITGHENAIVGSLSMRNSVSGFWNSALGSDSLRDNINGSRNVAVGYLTLSKNISGHRNVAVGSMALMRNTHGINNIGIGADSVWYNTTGNYNIGIGLASLSSSVTGDYNIGIGVGALLSANAANDNIAIGCYALTNNTSQGSNIAIGNYALTHSVATGGTNLAIGYQACYSTTTGYYNHAIGRQACYCNTTGQDNFAIGEVALYFNQTGQRNVAIGNLAGKGTGPCNVNRNVFIGHNAGLNITTGGDYNTVIGASSGVTTTTGANNILIGYNVNAPTGTTSNHLNIGNTIYGNTSTKRIGVNVTSPSAKLHLPASTSAAASAPIKLDAGALMATPEIGAVEFDGAHLYFTDSTGTRRTIAVV